MNFLPLKQKQKTKQNKKTKKQKTHQACSGVSKLSEFICHVCKISYSYHLLLLDMLDEFFGFIFERKKVH